MAVTGRWNGHRFEINARKIVSWKDLKITSASETEEKKSGASRYMKFKAGKPADVAMTVPLHARLGVDVRAEAEQLMKEARSGAADYFYMGGKKLLPCRLMLTQAVMSEHEILNDQWIRCEMQLTFRQADKYDDVSGTSGSSGGSKKRSSSGGGKKLSVKTTAVTVSTAASYETEKDVQYKAKLQIAKIRSQANTASVLKIRQSDNQRFLRVVK